MLTDECALVGKDTATPPASEVAVNEILDSTGVGGTRTTHHAPTATTTTATAVEMIRRNPNH
jgi:hypothetical protein